MYKFNDNNQISIANIGFNRTVKITKRSDITAVTVFWNKLETHLFYVTKLKTSLTKTK